MVGRQTPLTAVSGFLHTYGHEDLVSKGQCRVGRQREFARFNALALASGSSTNPRSYLALPALSRPQSGDLSTRIPGSSPEP